MGPATEKALNWASGRLEVPPTDGVAVLGGAGIDRPRWLAVVGRGRGAGWWVAGGKAEPP